MQTKKTIIIKIKNMTILNNNMKINKIQFKKEEELIRAGSM